MKADDVIHAQEALDGQLVVIEGYIGHQCDWSNINRGDYETTWISSGLNGDDSNSRIKLLPSESYRRPFKFLEMIRGSRGGCVSPEITEAGLVRFCGQYMKGGSPGDPGSLKELQWCEIPLFQPEYKTDSDGIRKKVGEYEFTWRVTIAPGAPKPQADIKLFDLIGRDLAVPLRSIKTSGVIFIEARVSPLQNNMHILAPVLADEHTPSVCARIELGTIPGTLGAIPTDIDLQDRTPDMRIFSCIIEGDFEPQRGTRWSGRFYNLRELVVLDELQSARASGSVGNDVRGYLFFPKEILARNTT